MLKLRRALAAGQFPESMQFRIVGAEMLGVIMIDVSGDVVSWDPVAEKIFGWSNDHAVGRCLADLFTVVSLDGSHPHADAGGILTALTGEGSWSGSVTSKCASDSLGQSLVAVSSRLTPRGR